MFKINNVSIIQLTVLLFIFTSCKKDYLSFDYTDGNIKEEDVWTSDRHARGFLNTAYSGILNRYNLTDGAMLASATDEAVNSNLGSTINIFNNDTWGPLRTFDDQYANMYSFIRRTNLFLEKSINSAIVPASDIPKLRGEAFFLRALYHFELMKRYGAIVIANKSFAPGDELDLPRNPVNEVVSVIVKDCDSAAAVLTASISDQSTGDKGRATQTAAMALKARTLLYAASPLNTAGEQGKWQQAADAAKAIIDLNKHSLLSLAQLPNLWNYTTLSYNAEVIFASQADNTNVIERNNAPISYDGALGRTNPTQEMVDAFEMKASGKPISDTSSGYLASNPYNGRDPRLALFVMVNGSSFKSKTVDIFTGGKDNVPTNINSTKTGYYLRKFLNESSFWGVGAATNVRRPWVLFRYAEVLLNYAEALNEAQGPVADVHKYVNMVRTRATMPNLPAGLSKESMRERIHNERRVELCFEEQRFYDVRRWKKGELFNRPVSGLLITRTNNVLSYQVFQVENRIFKDKMYRFPIPQTELNKTSKLGQNPGW